MKRILLASASIVAFAGAASAEPVFSGDATLGYNDTVADVGDNHDGFYWETNLALGAAVELNNGLTATIGFDIDVNDDELSGDLNAGGLFISLVSDEAGLYFGNTSFAAEKNWVNVDEMAADGFSEEDGETVIRGDITYSGVNASLSYNVADADGNNAPSDVDQLSLGATATFGAFAFSLAYQEESDAVDGPVGDYDPEGANGDFNADEILGVSASSVFMGVDTLIGYAENMTAEQTSIGVAVSYPVGPVNLVGFYVMEDGNLEDEDAFGIGFDYISGPIALEARYKEVSGDVDSRIEGTYDLGNGITALGGVVTGGDDYYIGAKVDMGAGATLLATYAVDDNGDQEDEIGNGDYQEGATVELTLAF